MTSPFQKERDIACTAVALSRPEWGRWGPRHRSTIGPQRYRLIVASAGSPLMISTCAERLQNSVFRHNRECACQRQYRHVCLPPVPLVC